MSQISATEAPHLQQIDLTTLNIQQLTSLKQKLDRVSYSNLTKATRLIIALLQELNLFQESLQSLKVAQTKYSNSGECLEKITPESEGKSILVPLTGSVSFCSIS